MKITVRLPMAIVLLSSLTTLLAMSSCKLLDEPQCPEPPYFPFSVADKQWQNFTVADEWVFENQRKQRRTYRVSKIYHSEKSPWYVGVFTERVGYYVDCWGMSWERSDSTASAGYCQFQRIPKKDPSQSTLSSEAHWNDYIGQANDTGGLYAKYLDFGPDLSAMSFNQLTIRGVNYAHVTHFQSSNLAISRIKMYGTPQKTTQLDYDQRAGVISFVTLNGDKWERVP